MRRLAGSAQCQSSNQHVADGFKSFTWHQRPRPSCILITRAKKSSINSRDGGLRVDTSQAPALYQTGVEEDGFSTNESRHLRISA